MDNCEFSFIKTNNKSSLFKFGDEQDIFSKLPNEAFDQGINEQCGNVLNAFRHKFYLFLESNKMDSVLPKLVFSKDNDSLLIQMKSNWKNGDALLFLSFEKDKDDSSFGIVWNDDEKSYYETKSGSIEKTGVNSVVEELIAFISRVY